MKPIASTAEILFFKMTGRSVDERWVAWAYDMIVAGFDTESLVMLAGEQRPFNQFEMQHLAEKAFQELNLRWDDRELVLRNYACYVIAKKTMVVALDILKEAHVDLNYEMFYHDFYLLYHAKHSLDNYGDQYYWDGATEENIDAVIKECFVEWRNKCG